MSFLRHLFGRDVVKAPQASTFSRLAPDATADFRPSAAGLAASRRELMRAVLRKTLTRHGIPAAWVDADMLVATSRQRDSGMHWRLLIRHWDPRLLTHAVALQNALVMRLLREDPLAADWLMGVSWQFALANEAGCPALPQPGFWTADPRPDAAVPSPAPDPAEDGAAEVIAGPVRITTTAGLGAEAKDSVRQDLDKLLAVRDAELQRHGDTATGLEPTRPMYLPTQPLPLRPDRTDKS